MGYSEMCPLHLIWNSKFAHSTVFVTPRIKFRHYLKISCFKKLSPNKKLMIKTRKYMIKGHLVFLPYLESIKLRRTCETFTYCILLKEGKKWAKKIGKIYRPECNWEADYLSAGQLVTRKISWLTRM